nr:YhcN/YlaJ family sporulation lipoprotein [Caldalkalibacillus salinus]
MSSVLLITGCQPNDQQQGMGAQSQDQNHFGSKQAQYQGKGAQSIYRNRQGQGANYDAPERSIFPLAQQQQQSGTDQSARLRDGDSPGTRTGRDQMPYGYAESSVNDPFAAQAGYGAQSYIDRQVLADTISQVIVGLPQVDDASVLVTDQNCIIGYRPNENAQNMGQQNGQNAGAGRNNGQQAGQNGTTAQGNQQGDINNIVEMSGLSCTPRWFKVYATDDMDLVQSATQADNDGTDARKSISKEVERIIEQLGGPKNSWDQPYIPNMDAGQGGKSGQQAPIENAKQQQGNNSR